MLASLSDAPLEDPAFVYEPKYDGIRAVAEIAARGGPVRLWSRLGNDKAGEFPGVVAALRHWATPRQASLVLDGEIVALDALGRPAGFQSLQRTHADCAFIAFDVLRDGASDLRSRPLLERRQHLERIFTDTASPILRISEMVRGDGRSLYQRALAGGWEGLIAKRAGSAYQPGKRTPDWRKIKILHEQEFVIGGWTEPRHSRAHFGALLLGVYDGAGDATSKGRSATAPLTYAGHVGTGFSDGELARLIALLKPMETGKNPFRDLPRSNEKPHWVRPTLVAQVKFTEWTADGSLRHPVYLGLRDDKAAKDVRREAETRVDTRVQGSGFKVQGSGSGSGSGAETEALLDRLRALEAARRDGILTLPGGASLKVTNLHKVFWPEQKLTKGDLMRYYVEVARFILPAVADRPLVMKRYPNGIAGKPFYQHRAPDVPAGVRVDTVPESSGGGAGPDHHTRPQIVGGDLTTLLYMTQLAAISQDPWFSRVASPAAADYVALDLDPMPGVSFARVLDVAKWIRDELASLGAIGVPKTSGADGAHIYVPLPAGTPYETGLLFCQIVATVVAEKHPKLATVERSVKGRGRRVYVDYLQNIAGKTLATAYSARASEYAGVSMPLTWDEVDAGVEREAFTIATVPARLRSVGDLWAALRSSKGVDLSRATRYGTRR